MRIIRCIIPLLFFFVFISCNKTVELNENEACAFAYGETLYINDISELITDDLDAQDSIRQAQSIINQWLRTQIKLNQAEKFFSPETPEIQKQIEEYKNSLIIYQYEQLLIAQKLDTSIAKADIKEYYEQYMNEFRLQGTVVKAIYAVIPNNSHKIYQFRNWLKNYKPENKVDIDEYCNEFAEVYDDFSNNWVKWDHLKQGIQHEIKNESRFLKNTGFDEWRKNEKVFFFKIIETKLNGDIAPLSMVKKDIRSILLNKRKINLLKEIEESAYQDAINSNQIKIIKANQ